MTHFLRFFFDENGAVWYHASVWGNVVAALPCGILAFLWARSSKVATHALLRQHHAEAAEQRTVHALHAEERQVQLLERQKPKPRTKAKPTS